MIINVSRGALVDTDAAIEALESAKLGGLAIDVYEHEGAKPSQVQQERNRFFPTLPLGAIEGGEDMRDIIVHMGTSMSDALQIHATTS